MSEITGPSGEPPVAPDAGAGVPRASLGRNTALMASGTAVSRVLGFARNALLVAAIGVNAGAANAYEVANKIPNALFAVLAAGVLNAVLVPQIVKAFARPDGKRTVDRILTLGGVASLAVTILLTLIASLLVRVYSDNWPPELVALATAMALWCIPQLFFYGMYTLLGQVLNARGQYGPFMWAPVLNNLVGIAGLVWYLAVFGRYAVGVPEQAGAVLTESWTAGRIALLAGVATLGIAAQAAILIWPLVRGGYRFRWVWRGPRGELRGVRVVAAWALAAVLLEQVGVLLTSRVATAANPGNLDQAIAGNAAYYNALILYLVPHSLITVSIITVLFTSMSKLAVAHDMAGLRAEVSRGLRIIGVFTIFASVALIVLSPLVVRVALPTATPVVVTSVAEVLVAMSLGLVPLGAMVLMKRVFFVLEDARSVFVIHIPMTIAWVGIAYAGKEFLEPRWWVITVGLGLAASNLVALLFRMTGLRRKLGGIDGARVARVYGTSVAAALIAGAAGWGVLRLGPQVESLTGAKGVALALALCVGVGSLMLAIYGAFLRWWRVEELTSVVAPALNKLRRRVR
jgi:putative peptidoglycan lipid II flippase